MMRLSRWLEVLGTKWLFLLQLTVSITLAARGWLTWKWDSPMRSLVWQEDWWSGPLEKLVGIPWRSFAEHSEPALTNVLENVGIGLMACAVVPWLVTLERLRWTRWLLVPAGILLALDALGRWVTVDWELGMAVEHSLQVVTPFALLIALRTGPGRAWRLTLAVATSLTFIGHGLYAMGFHAVPLIFKTMTMRILSCDLETAMMFLRIAGWLDLIAVLFLWMAPLRRWALFYMILWGFATALARVWAYFPGTLDPWVAETLVRTSHWLLPLLLLACRPVLPPKRSP
tara:strand:+ start:1426 stop:2283 length:858 start_codon:yes stop_codon:yes gene_type:complete